MPFRRRPDLHSRGAHRFGSYRTIGELGRGGMGVVYEAHDETMDRRVALKMLSAGLSLGERSVERFRREARIVGKLKHTNIVTVWATGIEKQPPLHRHGIRRQIRGIL